VLTINSRQPFAAVGQDSQALSLMFLLLALADQTYQLYVFIQTKIETGLIDELQKNETVKGVLAYFNLTQSEIIICTSNSTNKTPK